MKKIMALVLLMTATAGLEAKLVVDGLWIVETDENNAEEMWRKIDVAFTAVDPLFTAIAGHAGQETISGLLNVYLNQIKAARAPVTSAIIYRLIAHLEGYNNNQGGTFPQEIIEELKDLEKKVALAENQKS